MKNSIRIELANHILDRINDGVLNDSNRDDWHFHSFNEDYYVIGYHTASEWLKRHGMDAFEAVGLCMEYERDNFGEVGKTYDNAEVTVNMLAYIFGEELLSEIDAESIAELKAECVAIAEG